MTKKELEAQAAKAAKHAETRAAQAYRETKKRLKELLTDLWYNDIIIIVGLAASGVQLIIAFTYAGSWWSFFPALFKAAFIEASVWLLNKAISWHGLLKIRAGGVAFLWAVLVVVMFISTRANLSYEYKMKIQAHNEAENVVSSRKVDQYLESDEIFDAWLRGGLIPGLVLAMIFARRILTASRDTFEATEEKKFTEDDADERKRAAKRERDRLYRENKRAEERAALAKFGSPGGQS